MKRIWLWLGLAALIVIIAMAIFYITQLNPFETTSIGDQVISSPGMFGSS